MTSPAALPAPIELRAGELRCALRPDLGGCITGLWRGDLPVLRSTEPSRRALALALLPLVPYSTSWASAASLARQDTDGQLDDSRTPCTVGWQGRGCDTPTRTTRCSPGDAGDGDWPFAIDARQTIRSSRTCTSVL